MAIPVWIALLSLGLAAILAQSLVAEPLAQRAGYALSSLKSGHAAFKSGDVVALLSYASVLVLIPMLLLLGCWAIEKWMASNRERKGERLIWGVHLFFLATVVGASAIAAVAGLVPQALNEVRLRSASLPDWLELASLYVLALILADILFYWIHRAQHRFAWLWKFHAVHHSQDELDVLHGITHPVESITRLLLITFPIGYLVRFDLVPICLLASLIAIQTKLTHSRAPIHFGPLGALIADNRYHFIHHSRDPADYNSNFADRFPFIDRLFGTYREPRPLLPETGLNDRVPPSSLGHYLLAICPSRHDRFRA